jgi:hypothetical protein
MPDLADTARASAALPMLTRALPTTRQTLTIDHWQVQSALK